MGLFFGLVLDNHLRQYVRTGFISEYPKTRELIWSLLIGETNENTYQYLYDLLANGDIGACSPEVECSQGADLYHKIIYFYRNNLPEEAHGSEEKVKKWIMHRGLRGCDDNTKALIKLRSIDPFWKER